MSSTSDSTRSPYFLTTPIFYPNGVPHIGHAYTAMVTDAIADSTAASTPLGRFLTPEEVASCICFVASPRASAVTGAEFVVDGGLTTTM